MKMQTVKMNVTQGMKLASDAIRACGEHSIANPTCAIKDNPFVPEAERTMRALTGSKNGYWTCRCGQFTPFITGDLKTECCGFRVVNVRKAVAR